MLLKSFYHTFLERGAGITLQLSFTNRRKKVFFERNFLMTAGEFVNGNKGETSYKWAGYFVQKVGGSVIKSYGLICDFTKAKGPGSFCLKSPPPGGGQQVNGSWRSLSRNRRFGNTKVLKKQVIVDLGLFLPTGFRDSGSSRCVPPPRHGTTLCLSTCRPVLARIPPTPYSR